MNQCATYPRSGGWRWLCILMALAAAIGALVYCTDGLRMLSEQHAVERHGTISLTIKDVCDSNPKVTLTRATDGRKAVGCEYLPGKWGVTIYEQDGDHVTSFPNKARGLDDLMRYFQNRGFTQ